MDAVERDLQLKQHGRARLELLVKSRNGISTSGYLPVQMQCWQTRRKVAQWTPVSSDADFGFSAHLGVPACILPV